MSQSIGMLKSKPVFRYLDVRPVGPVGGRGNVVRLFMLAHNIQFDEELVSMQDWRNGEKERCVSEGINPGGYLPTLKIGDKYYREHVAIARYLARHVGAYGSNVEVDYEADAVCSLYEQWRDAWATTLTGGDGATSDYKDKRQRWYEMVEFYHARRSAAESPYFAEGDLPGVADIAVFNMSRDDGIKHGKVDMSPYPGFASLIDAVGRLPEVKNWIDHWEASCKS